MVGCVPAVLFSYAAKPTLLRLFGQTIRPKLRPWLWLAPALAFLIVFLVYPTLGTIVRSFESKAGASFVGFDNYVWFFTNSDWLIALRNSLIWLVVLTLARSAVGMGIALLVDRVRYETVAKSVIFVPIRHRRGGRERHLDVHVRLPHAARAAGQGASNAILRCSGIAPVAWLQISDYTFNTILLIVVMAWMWTGFAMVILSAALKGIDPELIEAARVDGANKRRAPRRGCAPVSIAVVTTTMIITALKAFDIIYVMTTGHFDTQVVAFQMINGDLRLRGSPGRASAIAVILLLAIIPVMAIDIRRFARRRRSDDDGQGPGPPVARTAPRASRFARRLPLHLVLGAPDDRLAIRRSGCS